MNSILLADASACPIVNDRMSDLTRANVRPARRSDRKIGTNAVLPATTESTAALPTNDVAEFTPPPQAK
jgi:hypothetical protein